MTDDNRFSTLLILALLFLIGGSSTAAQSQPNPQPTPDCPTVTVSSPDMVDSGQPITFTTKVRGGGNHTPTYNWTISAGTISSGQGTSSISVDTTGLPEGSSVTATIDVGNFGWACRTSNSSTTSIKKNLEPRKFDEYGKIASADENARLDNFAAALGDDPSVIGYIITYGGRRSQPDEAQKMAEAVAKYLMEKRGIPRERSLIAVGGYREEPATELWMAPADATPPLATPNVDPSEVVPAKASPKPAPAKKPAKAKPTKGKKS